MEASAGSTVGVGCWISMSLRPPCALTGTLTAFHQYTVMIRKTQMPKLAVQYSLRMEAPGASPVSGTRSTKSPSTGPSAAGPNPRVTQCRPRASHAITITTSALTLVDYGWIAC